ncbi:MAG: formylglycine-generating enzyme family protein [Deltaproteobacteria bacterium]|nr:formylglycine-generating enzyme family protein [Deltaproteobacteria bacterium]
MDGKLTKAAFLFLLSALFAAPAAPAAAQELPPRFTNSLGMEFVLVPQGSYTMGPGPAFLGGAPDGSRTRKVSIRNPFYIGVTEVTQQEWQELTGRNPSYRRDRGNPVESVSFDDAKGFVKLLNDLTGGKEYRLPTEAEWEYAARGGSGSNYFFGDTPGKLHDYAWYDGDMASGSHHPVAQKKPNPYGLYDMYGNVFEWTTDLFDDGARGGARNPQAGGMMVIRGGCFGSKAEDLQSASRFMELPATKSTLIGLRVVRDASFPAGKPESKDPKETRRQKDRRDRRERHERHEDRRDRRDRKPYKRPPRL